MTPFTVYVYLVGWRCSLTKGWRPPGKRIFGSQLEVLKP